MRQITQQAIQNWIETKKRVEEFLSEPETQKLKHQIYEKKKREIWQDSDTPEEYERRVRELSYKINL